MRAEQIRAADGTQLSARVYEPDSPDLGNVVIGGAMGVRQDFYAPFARWLAGQGWRVITFDYRGSGDSGPSGNGLRGFKADLFDWTHDYEAAIDHAKSALPQKPLYLLGHSLGAQLPGLQPRAVFHLGFAKRFHRLAQRIHPHRADMLGAEFRIVPPFRHDQADQAGADRRVLTG